MINEYKRLFNESVEGINIDPVLIVPALIELNKIEEIKQLTGVLKGIKQELSEIKERI